MTETVAAYAERNKKPVKTLLAVLAKIGVNLKAEDAFATQDWRTAYVMYKRYGLLTLTAIPKHNAYGQKKYEPARNKCKR